MIQKDKMRERKIRNITIVLVFSAIVSILATFAWFFGMRSVYISSFDIDIAATDSLLLSLDGKAWDTLVHIDKSNYDDLDVVYEGHTNSWGSLIPVSSVGKVDGKSSRLVLYEQSSITPSKGGYRIMTSRVENHKNLTKAEPNGYIAFDLFVKNFSARQYISELNILDEEAIYLTTNSEVKVSDSGLKGTGIENSARVAFTQIGRVIGTTLNQEKITTIKCNGDNNKNSNVVDGVTGICRDSTIWEPNDLDHEENAIKYYNTSCRRRTGNNVHSNSSYSGSCKTVVDGKYYRTYAVNSPIKSSDNVDRYDGRDYNYYTKSNKLTEFNYFTDSMKDLTGIDRPEIFTLSPNSITKLRIYVYIEGQDIDNYTFAQLGNSFTVNFGFTKERFTTEEILDYDIDYSNDTYRPVITIVDGIEEITINVGESFEIPKATAWDMVGTNIDGPVEENLTRKIVITHDVDNTTPGEYLIAYDVSDWAGNYADRVYVKVIVLGEPIIEETP